MTVGILSRHHSYIVWFYISTFLMNHFIQIQRLLCILHCNYISNKKCHILPNFYPPDLFNNHLGSCYIMNCDVWNIFGLLTCNIQQICFSYHFSFFFPWDKIYIHEILRFQMYSSISFDKCIFSCTKDPIQDIKYIKKEGVISCSKC